MRPSRLLKRIALVDDDPSALAMLGLGLRRAGFRVSAFVDPEDFLVGLRPGRYGWLVTDARMIPLDGFALAARAKTVDPGLRIVMVTAMARQWDLADGNIERLFSKPLELDDLVSWLRRAGAGSWPAWD